MQLWAKDGHLLVNAGTGQLIACDACPCNNEAQCEANVKAAIRERQNPAGRTQWTAPQAAAKTLGDCRSEISAMGPSFLNATYSPSTQVPSCYSSSHANSATTWCELDTIIRQMMSTYKVPTLTPSVTNPIGLTSQSAHRYLGTAGGSPQIWGQQWSYVKQIARTSWAASPSLIYSNYPRCWVEFANDSHGQNGYGLADSWRPALSAYGPISTARQTSIYRCFHAPNSGTPPAPTTYDTEGIMDFAEGVYHPIRTTDLSAWSSWAFEEWPTVAQLATFPENWPDPGPSTGMSFMGFDPGAYWLLTDWSFAYHP